MKRYARLARFVLPVVLSGCGAMCQSPWDYCSAVVGPGGTPNCDFGARAGSAFAPMGGTPVTTARGPTPAAGKKQPAVNGGSGDAGEKKPSYESLEEADEPRPSGL
jgi:hypothetical protein